MKKLLAVSVLTLLFQTGAHAFEHTCSWKQYPGDHKEFARDVNYKITKVNIQGLSMHHMSVTYAEPNTGRVIFKQEGIATVRQHSGGHNRFILGKEQIGIDDDGFVRCFR